MNTLKALWQKVPLFWRLAGPALLLALAVIAFVQSRPDGRLHLHFLPVGQGNAILVVSPAGQTVLIDGGPDATALLSALGHHLPFWKPALDMVIVTETDPARLAGPLAALERYRTQAAGRPGRVQRSTGWERWQELLARQGVAAAELQRGSRVELGDGVVIEIVHPAAALPTGVAPAGRDDALVLRVTYGHFSAMLPTAAGPAGQQALLQAGAVPPSSVLLIPRQAEHQALDPAFLQAARPAVAVVSAGSGYHQGPDARTLALVQAAGSALYRTDRQGTVEVVTDGTAIWVWTER